MSRPANDAWWHFIAARRADAARVRFACAIGCACAAVVLIGLASVALLR